VFSSDPSVFRYGERLNSLIGNGPKAADMSSPAATPSPFGLQLRHWRRVRGWSQLDLALRAEISPRHLSFMETGRSRPTAGMVLRLAEALDVPLRERNELLNGAGLAPAYPERALNAEELAPFRAIVDRMLKQHEPYPAFAIDRWWDIVAANRPAQRLLPQAFAGDNRTNAIEVFLAPGMVRDIMENWQELAWTTVARLRREVAAAGSDRRLRALLDRAEALIADVHPPDMDGASTPVVASRLRLGDRLVHTVTTIASFSAARDVTLDELRIELVFPADDEADAFFRQVAAAADGPGDR
jgi:transcriptional regulator with XRE-family HTH domain